MANRFIESLQQKSPAVKRIIALTFSSVIAGIIAVIAIINIYFVDHQTATGPIDTKRQSVIDRIKKDLGHIKGQASGAKSIKQTLEEDLKPAIITSTSTTTGIMDAGKATSSTSTAGNI